VDARRAYEVGALDLDGLRRSYRDLGYDDKRARTLVDFAKITSGPVRAKRAGNASAPEVLGWYRDGMIDREAASTYLRIAGIKADNISTTLDTEDARRTIRLRKQEVAALRKRYMQGEYSPSQAMGALRLADVPVDSVEMILSSWEHILATKYKAPTVAMLCRWWQDGLITMDEYLRRVGNLGYDYIDAGRIAASCRKRLEEKLEAEVEKLQKEAEKRAAKVEQEKRRRERELAAAKKSAEKDAKERAPCKPPPKPVCPTPGAVEE
jgi:hypothetical protein